MKPYSIGYLGILIALQLTTVSSFCQDTNALELIRQMKERIDALEEKVRLLESEKASRSRDEGSAKQQQLELEQKVKVLERNRELEFEASEAKAKELPKISIGGEGFGFSSADGQFGIQLKGVLQVDSRTFLHDSNTRGNDGFLLRRARPILQGTLWKDFEFLFIPDFGGTGSPQIFDAYLNYRYQPWLQLRAGKFKVPFGLEQLQADADTLFNERSLVTTLVPNRDLGVQLHGDILDGVVSYAAGIFNGVGDARNSNNADFDDNKSFAGRLFFHPFKKSDSLIFQGLGLGVAGSYEHSQGVNTVGLPSTTGGTFAGYATAGQQQYFAYAPENNAVIFADGKHWRLSPQAYYYYGPFGFLAEYAISEQRLTGALTTSLASDTLHHQGWQISGSWILTGENAAFKGGVVPRHRFNPAQGTWGALQLVARYEELDIDDAAFPLFADPTASASGANGWSVGLNWYLNRNVLVKASFSHTWFDGGGGSGDNPPASVTRQDENVLFTRIQLAF
jgi:phosphate-selective porin OprO and OprP